MRSSTACVQCKNTKRKCRIAATATACVTCEKRRQPCSFSRLIKRGTLPVPIAPEQRLAAAAAAAESHDQLEDNINSLIDTETQVELVDLYIQYVHDRPQSIFHQPTLRNAVVTGTISKALLLAICSIGCRFSSDRAIRTLEDRLLARSKQTLLSSLDVFSLDNIQTCILINHLAGASLDTASEALYLSIAIRMAQMIRLGESDPSDSAIMYETKRRVWWSLFMADTWSSTALGLPRQMTDFHLTQDCPIDESVFHRADYGGLDSPSSNQPGMWSLRVMLANMFGQTQDLYYRLVQDKLTDDEFDGQVVHLAGQFQHWEDTLLENFKMSDRTIHLHRSLDQGGSFIDLHLGYHYYVMLLYFNYLDTERSQSEQRQHYARLCRQHATTYSRLLGLTKDYPDCKVVHATMAHMTVVCSSILLHKLLLGDGTELADTRAALVSNFEVLVDLRRFWPKMDVWIQRLYTFQAVCAQSTTANTHKIDRWMIKFLLEYALPLHIKTSDIVPSPVQQSSLSRSGRGYLVDFSERKQIVTDLLADLS